uniref:CCHC-type domain-containing protein n=1 Tax=Tanacetum cinerariifolium TaxID=118510 RepID=A0A699H185_TANCI|nr:hypothetical protein [Tanacetum cinerariifolium]
MTDYSLWEVILNGDSPTPTRVVDGVVQPIAPTTAEQRLAKKNELKARGTLLMALPDKHQLKFNIQKDAKSLMEAIKKRFGGNKEIKKAHKTLIKQKYKNFSGSNNDALKQIDADDLEETNLKWQMAMLAMRARRFLQRTRRNLRANGTNSIGFDMSKVECYNCHRRGHFARECRSPRDTRNKDTQRRTVLVETFSSNALVSQCDGVVFDYDELNSSESDVSVPTCQVHDRYKSSEGYHDVPPPYTGTFMPPKPNLVFYDASIVSETVLTVFNVEPSTTKPTKDMSQSNRPSAPIIKDWVFDLEDESEDEHMPTQKAPSFVQTSKHVKTPRKSVKSVEHPTQAENIRQDILKSREVLTRSRLVPLNAARPITTVVPQTHVKHQSPVKHVVNKPHSPIRRPINHKPAPKNSNFHQKVTTVKAKQVNDVQGTIGNWVWKPKCTVLDHVSRLTSESMTLKQFNYTDALGKSKSIMAWGPQKTLSFLFDMQGNPQQALKDKGVIDSGYSRHITRNISYLFDFEEINGEYVAFGGNPKGEKITGKGKIKTGKLDFDDVDFFKELKFNLFSVSQMCDNKNNVVFTDTECVVLSFDFKLPDENHMLLRNGVAERKYRTLIEAARTMLADSLLPIPFCAEAVNTACYVQNRVLVTKPHNKTPYELLLGRTPSIGFMRHFGCPVTILNTLDPLEKFDGKADEGFLVGYSVNSKAFRVFNRNGRTWLFDIDTLTQSMNYQPVATGNQPNHNAGIQGNFDADADAAFDDKENESAVHVSLSSSDKPTKHDEKAKRESKGKSQVDLSTGVRDLSDEFEEFSVNSTNRVNAANMLALEDFVYSDDEEDVGTEAEFSNLETSIIVSPIPTTRVHKDHPVTQIIGDLSLASQTRSMARMALKDPSWIKDMQEELLQFKMQKVWVLVVPKGKRDIGSKWVFRNKKDKRGTVIKNKARLVAQGHTQEEGIDYEKVFALVVRIEAIWLFLAYASFMGFMELCKDFEKLMKDKFQMSSIGELAFLGITNGKSASTSIDTEKHLLKDPDGEDVDVHIYRSMIGSLMYLTSSKPDIMFVVCACVWNLGEPSSLFNFEEVMNNNRNQEPPPQNGPPTMMRPNGEAPRTMEELFQNTCQFHGLPGDDANRDIDKFMEITQHIKQNRVSDDALRLSLFPYSLTHHAIAWYDRLPRNSIHSFDDMMRKFLSKYFPPSMVTKLSKNLTQTDTFYNGLTLSHRDTIIAAAGGTFMQKTLEECYELIENMTAQHNHWDIFAIRDETSRNISSTSTIESPELVRQLEMMNKNFSEMMRQFQMIKAVDKKCETCGGPHSFTECPAIGGYTQETAYATTGNYNSGETITDQVLTGSTNNVSPLVVQPSPASTSFSNNNYSSKMPEVTKDTIQPSTENIQPSVAQTQIPIYEPIVDPKLKPTIPYPSRVNKQKLHEIEDNLALKFVEIFRNLHFELSFADALLHMPKFALMFKSLLNNKEKLFDLATTLVNENCLAVILKKLPEKLGDPDEFLIPCDFPETGRALIYVYGEELTLRVDDVAITFNVGQTSKYSYNDTKSINRIDVIDVACKEYVQEGGDFILEEIEASLISESIPSGIDYTDLDLKGDIHLLEELLNNDPSLSPLPPKELNVEEIKTAKSFIDEPLEL